MLSSCYFIDTRFSFVIPKKSTFVVVSSYFVRFQYLFSLRNPMSMRIYSQKTNQIKVQYHSKRKKNFTNCIFVLTLIIGTASIITFYRKLLLLPKTQDMYNNYYLRVFYFLFKSSLFYIENTS